MKLILFAIFSIILNSISSKNLKFSDIFKVDNSGKNFNTTNKTEYIYSTNNYHQKDQKDLQKPYYSTFGHEQRLPQNRQKIGKIGLKCYTGIIGISCDKMLDLQKERFFLACCAIGGLNSNKQIFDAYKWAKSNNYLINDKKSYKEFAKRISEKFQTNYHSDWKIKEKPENGIFWVEDSKEKGVFNPSGFENNINLKF
jgi:hypothetical protein